MIKKYSKELHISIGFDIDQKKQLNDRNKAYGDTPAHAPEKSKSAMQYGFAVVLLFLLFFGGYHIYESITAQHSRWDIEEFAPKKKNWLLQEQSDRFKTEIENQESILLDQPILSPRPEETAEGTASAQIGTKETPDHFTHLMNKASPLKEEIDRGHLQSVASVLKQKSVILFGHNSNELPIEAYETLDNIIKIIQRHPKVKISVNGYADSYGNRTYNLHLSQYRANMVKNYLIGNGVSPSKISARGRGSANPLYSNATVEGRKQNRRVEVRAISE